MFYVNINFVFDVSPKLSRDALILKTLADNYLDVMADNP